MSAQERKSLCSTEAQKHDIFISILFRYTNEKYDGGLHMKYDIIGDIHGCFHEFQDLTKKLGYSWNSDLPIHPDRRKLAFVGDITDRGPHSLRMIEIVWELVINKKSLITLQEITVINYTDFSLDVM